jgi:hypothetical protein
MAYTFLHNLQSFHIFFLAFNSPFLHLHFKYILPQQSLKTPPEVNIFEKYRRGIRRKTPSYISSRSRAAPVLTGSYGPMSMYNSILKKQLGLLTSRT